MSSRTLQSNRIIVLGALLLTVAAVPSTAQNLIVNPTFDVDASSWIEPNQNVTIIHRPDVGNVLPGGSGPGSMEVQFRGWNGTNSGAVQDIDVIEGEIYEFSGAYFSPSVENVALGVRANAYWLDENGASIGFDQITDYPPLVENEWTPISGSVTAPEGTTKIRLQVAVENPSSTTETRPGIAYFDDLWFARAGTSAATQELFVSAAASTPGSGGTFWTTTAWISNLTDSTVKLAGAALLPGQNNSSAVNAPSNLGTVQPGGFLSLEDVYQQLGAASQTGGLFIQATATGELPFTPLISMTTYTSTPNQTGAGAYGQGIPATSSGSLVKVVCPGIRDMASHRTNVGVLNTSDRIIDVEVAIVDGAGVTVGSQTWRLDAYEQRQQRVTTLGAAGIDGGTAVFRLLSPEGSFLAYASMVDNATGDAVYVEGR